MASSPAPSFHAVGARRGRVPRGNGDPKSHLHITASTPRRGATPATLTLHVGVLANPEGQARMQRPQVRSC